MQNQQFNKNADFCRIILPMSFPILIYEEEYLPDLSLLNPQSIHDCLQIGYCVKGEGFFLVHDTLYEYSSGTLTIVPPFVVHHCLFSKETKNIWRWLYMDPIYFSQVLPHDDQTCILDIMFKHKPLNYVLTAKSCPQFHSLVSIIDAIYYENKYSESNNSVIELLLNSLMYKTIDVSVFPRKSPNSRPQKNQSDLFSISPAIRYISKNYSKRITVSQLAQICLMSESHLRNIFHSAMGCSPMQYVSLYRIEMACSLILSNNYTLSEVSEKVGFVTYSSFLRQFQSIFNQPPSDWLNKIKYNRHERSKD